MDFPIKNGDFSGNPGYPAIEIVDLPWIYPLTLNMVDLSIVNVYQRVTPKIGFLGGSVV